MIARDVVRHPDPRGIFALALMSLIDLAAWGYAVYSLFATDQIRVDREKLVYTRRVLIPIRRRQVLLTRIANVDLRTIPTGKRTQTIIRIDADDGGLSFGIGVDPEELARWAQPLRERVMAAARHTMPAPLHKPNGELSATASEGGAKIPIELLVPPPRKVRLRPGRRAAVISILILAILIACRESEFCFMLPSIHSSFAIRSLARRPLLISRLSTATETGTTAWNIHTSLMASNESKTRI